MPHYVRGCLHTYQLSTLSTIAMALLIVLRYMQCKIISIRCEVQSVLKRSEGIYHALMIDVNMSVVHVTYWLSVIVSITCTKLVHT